MINLTNDDRLTIRETALLLCNLRDMFLVTSGSYQKFNTKISYLRELADREDECTPMKLLAK